MTLPALLLAVSTFATPAFAAGSEGHHTHEEDSLPAGSELCSCGQSVVTRSDCLLENSAGACILSTEKGGECKSWHCHPGEAEAHKAPWRPGKAVALDALPEEKRAVPPGAESCKPEIPEQEFPHPLHGPSPSDLQGCLRWTAETRVDYPAADGKADCSRPAPTLVTRCAAALDPLFRLSRANAKDQECHCGEWTAVAKPIKEGERGVSQTSTCTAFLCRPRRKG